MPAWGRAKRASLNLRSPILARELRAIPHMSSVNKVYRSLQTPVVVLRSLYRVLSAYSNKVN